MKTPIAVWGRLIYVLYVGVEGWRSQACWEAPRPGMCPAIQLSSGPFILLWLLLLRPNLSFLPALTGADHSVSHSFSFFFPLELFVCCFDDQGSRQMPETVQNETWGCAAGRREVVHTFVVLLGLPRPKAGWVGPQWGRSASLLHSIPSIASQSRVKLLTAGV